MRKAILYLKAYRSIECIYSAVSNLGVNTIHTVLATKNPGFMVNLCVKVYHNFYEFLSFINKFETRTSCKISRYTTESYTGN